VPAVLCVISLADLNFSAGSFSFLFFVLAYRNYTRAGLPFRNTMFVAPVGTNSGLRSPHLLATSTIDYPAGKPLPPPRLQLPSGGPGILFAGARPCHSATLQSHLCLSVCLSVCLSRDIFTPFVRNFFLHRQARLRFQ
jgi:hypothetical protein